MANLSLSEIINRKLCKFDETSLWCILSLSLETIQNLSLIEKSGLFLITPDNTYISAAGKLIFLSKSHYSKTFYPPKSYNLNLDWSKSSADDKSHILLYSLGKTLEFCINCKKGETSLISKELWFIINQITDRTAKARIGLSNLQQMCNKMVKDYIKEKSMNEYLIEIHQTSTQMPKMMRSLSSSNLFAKGFGKNRDRNISLGTKHKKPDNEEKVDSNDIISQNNSPIISSNASDSNVNSSNISTPRSLNLYQPRLDNLSKSNIPAAMERVKALRKEHKNHGPMRSPRNIVNGLQNSTDSINNMISANGHSAISVNSLKEQFTETPNVDKPDNVKRILGPEFIIQQSETLNVTSSLQRKASLFSRTDSTRQISHAVQVHLLNGVKLFVRNLNKQSILGHVINSIHCAFPELEFVNYGLCFMLDNEYFYLKEEVNIQRLADYMTQKLSSSKTTNESENKKELNLYYRIKFYPTADIISDMNSFNRKLFYLQLRQDLLFNNNPPISLRESVEIAGIAIQAEFGQIDKSLTENKDYLKIEYYFHKLFRPLLDTNNDETSFLRFQQEHWIDESWEKCERILIEKVCEKKYYGLHWYRVNKNQLGIIGAIGKNTYLVIGREYIQLLDSSRSRADVQMHKHFSYRWRQIESISIKHKKLVIKPKMQLKVEGLNSPSAFVCYLDSKTKAEHIVRLCNEHHLLASQTDELDNSLVLTQSPIEYHVRPTHINYPSALIRSSLTYDDDNISVNDHSSEEEVCPSSRYLPHTRRLSKQKYLLAGSLNNLSNPRKMRSTSFYSNSCQDVNNEDHHRGSKETSVESQTKANTNHNSSNDFFEVTLTRNKSINENLGLGIIKIQTPSCEGFFIKRILEGSPTEKCGKLQIGDEIVIINDQIVSNLSQTQVGNIIMSCGKYVKLIIKARHLTDNEETVIRTIKKSSSFSQTETKLSDFRCLETNKIRHKFKISNKSVLQEILKSNNAFKIFHPNILEKFFPILKLSTNENHCSIFKAHIDECVPKEIRKLKAKMLLLSASHVNQIKTDYKTPQHSSRESSEQVSGLSYDIKIQYCKLILSNSNASLNDLNFTLFQMERKFNLLPWKFVVENNSKLIISFNYNPNNWLNLYPKVENAKIKNTFILGEYTINIDEIHLFSKSIAFYRLSMGTCETESSQSSMRQIYLINFDNWNTEIEIDKTRETILQSINIACAMHEHLQIIGSIVLLAETIDDKIGMFLSIYSMILLGVHRKLPISPIIKNKTIISEICSQINNQMNEIMLNENHYKICISILKQLLAYMDNFDNQSDVSDVN